MSGNPRLQPNGWWEQDRYPTWGRNREGYGPKAARRRRAAKEVAAFCNKTYDPQTRLYGEIPPPQHPKPQYRDPKTGRFAKRPKNKQHNHPPKRRANT